MRIIYFFIISILMFSNLLSQISFDSEPDVRVQIINSLRRLDTTFNGTWELTTENYRHMISGQKSEVEFILTENEIKIIENGNISEINEDSLRLICKSDDGTIKIDDVPYGVGWWWEGKEVREYEGIISIYRGKSNAFEVINELPLEEYLKGVVPYEMGNDSPLEALKAQAVAARSEAIIALSSKLYSGEHHDLTSDVECQVYSGIHKRTAITDKAVVETRSLIISEKGQPINAYYASNCGGHSELIKNVWPDRPDPNSYHLAGLDSHQRINLDLHDERDLRKWIFSKPEVFCNPDNGVELPPWSQKNFRWKKKFDVKTLSKMNRGEKDLGDLVDIEILRRGVSGRINMAKFIFENDTLHIEGELAIRQLWKPALRSSCFVIDKDSDSFILFGAGWGHGVGMCQSGAVALAQLEADFKTILKHYYQKAEIIKIY